GAERFAVKSNGFFAAAIEEEVRFDDSSVLCCAHNVQLVCFVLFCSVYYQDEREELSWTPRDIFVSVWSVYRVSVELFIFVLQPPIVAANDGSDPRSPTLARFGTSR